MESGLPLQPRGQGGLRARTLQPQGRSIRKRKPRLEEPGKAWPGRDDIKSLDDLRKAIESGDSEALEVAKAAAYTIGKNLCWPIQVRGSERLVITGPLSPILNEVRPSLIEGLSTLFSDDEIAALDPQASNDPQLAMQHGSARLARRLYIYPES